jgi:RNA polymerase sigma factor (sigma-70 family)
VDAQADEASVTQDTVRVLLDNHRRFLKFLESKVGSRETAEDLLQEAFTRHLHRTDEIPTERVVAWFYRVLRNAAIDHHRRRSVRDRRLALFAQDMEESVAPSSDLHQEICQCVSRLAATLKPEYEAALREVDVEGTAVTAFAERHGLSPSNAGVRVFRARQALRQRVRQSCGTCAEHGCLNCTCPTAPPAVV